MSYNLRKLLATGRVFCYINDILIATDNIEEHCQLIHGILQALQDVNLSIQESKCIFEASEMTFLGLIISEGTIHHSLKNAKEYKTGQSP